MKREELLQEIDTLETLRISGRLNADQLARCCAAIDALRWVIRHPGTVSPTAVVVRP